MWVKQNDKSYLDLSSGNVFRVSQNNRGEWQVVVIAQNAVSPSGVLGVGYKDQKEAQGELDELMSSQDVLIIQPPITKEETAEEGTK